MGSWQTYEIKEETMEHIESLKKEYNDKFTKASEYRTQLLEQLKNTENSMEQLRGAYQALEQLAAKLAPPTADDATKTPEGPKLAAVPNAEEPKAKKSRKGSNGAETPAVVEASSELAK